jgi:hypothetical protein
MAKRRQQNGRRIRIRSIRRDPPDLHKLSRALIALAFEQDTTEVKVERETGSYQQRENAA